MTALKQDTTRKVNTYTDLRGHGLEGTEYKWVFKITPTYSNNFTVGIHLKPVSMLSMFSKSRYSTEVTIDLHAVNFVDTMKATLDRVLTIEHVKRIIGDKEL